MSWDLFNVLGDADQHYKREANSIKDNRSDIRYGLGDHLRYGAAALLGRGDEFSYETMKKEITDAANKEVQQENDALRTQILEADALRGISRDPGSLKIKKGADAIDHRNMLEREANTSQFIADASQKYSDVDFTGVTTTGQALSRIQGKNREDNKLFGPAAVLERQMKRDEERDRRYYADREDTRRAENRRYELDILRLQQADKQKAQDRRDRMIMTLMNGLNNLGQAFTI